MVKEQYIAEGDEVYALGSATPTKGKAFVQIFGDLGLLGVALLFLLWMFRV